MLSERERKKERKKRVNIGMLREEANGLSGRLVIVWKIRERNSLCVE